MQINKVPKDELALRMDRFLREMEDSCSGWELCAITGSVNMYYLTGTICDGLLLIRRGGTATLWVRRSYDRSVLESEFGDIRRMTSFRDVANATSAPPDTLYLDTAHATLEWYGMLSKYIPFKNVLPVESVMLKIRSVKSTYEIERLRLAGTAVDRILREDLPTVAYEGISEVELGAELYARFIKSGHHGISRFSMRNTSEVFGHVAFGDSPLHPAVFNGASGTPGLCPAIPALGSRNKLLRAGDLVFVDVCYGVEGYNVDKTLVFSCMRPQPEHVSAAHKHCLELERLAVSMLRPGVSPSEMYSEVISSLKPEYQSCFMGAPGRQVPFIGHSVGLYVDETPVIAKGFDAPLESGMTIAIEPKIGLEGIGMVGSENTYLVTEKGGDCLTGHEMDIIVIC